jgi:hypothetical protein
MLMLLSYFDFHIHRLSFDSSPPTRPRPPWAGLKTVFVLHPRIFSINVNGLEVEWSLLLEQVFLNC